MNTTPNIEKGGKSVLKVKEKREKKVESRCRKLRRPESDSHRRKGDAMHNLSKRRSGKSTLTKSGKKTLFLSYSSVSSGREGDLVSSHTLLG